MSVTISSKDKFEKYAPWLTLLNDGNGEGWYIAIDDDDLTLSGSDVTRWDSKDDCGRYLVALGADDVPTFSSNIVTFDGTQQLETFGTVALIQPVTIYIVVRQDGWADEDGIICGETGTAYLKQNGSSPGIAMYAGSQSTTVDGPAISAWGIIVCVFNNTVSSLEVDGSSLWTGTIGTNNFTGYRIGGRGEGTNLAQLSFKEIIVRGVADDAEDRGIIYNYLKDKYGL